MPAPRASPENVRSARWLIFSSSRGGARGFGLWPPAVLVCRHLALLVSSAGGMGSRCAHERRRSGHLVWAECPDLLPSSVQSCRSAGLDQVDRSLGVGTRRVRDRRGAGVVGGSLLAFRADDVLEEALDVRRRLRVVVLLAGDAGRTPGRSGRRRPPWCRARARSPGRPRADPRQTGTRRRSRRRPRPSTARTRRPPGRRRCPARRSGWRRRSRWSPRRPGSPPRHRRCPALPRRRRPATHRWARTARCRVRRRTGTPRSSRSCRTRPSGSPG